MKKSLLLSGLLVFLFACTPPFYFKQPQPVDEKTYSIGEVKKIPVGSAMVSVTKGSGFDQYIITQTVTAKVPVYPWPVVTKGTLWQEKGTFEGHKVITSTHLLGGSLAFLINEDGTLATKKSLMSMTVANPNPMAKPLPGTYLFPTGYLPQHLFKKTKEKAMMEGGFKTELIYSGKSGNTISVNYREYKDDFARPAFYQQMQYDLSENSVITFRETVIKVLHADNNAITFEVLKD